MGHVRTVEHQPAPSPGAEPGARLPVRLSSFVGRRDEVTAVRRLLAASRLVALFGSGGCGKTRLALEVGHSLEAEYRDGVRWVDLAALSDPELVLATVASALGIREPPGVDLVEVLGARLVDRSVLVILDNCEHLVEACGALAEALLRSCPSLVILATSRERLGIEGETAFRVPSLSVPAGGDTAHPERFDAVRLFIERAAQVGVSVAADDTVAEVCRRLDGIPLAIELAAARARVLTPGQILDGLADQIGLLAGEGRGVVPRHRTLRASVDWSYSLLSEREQAVLAQLSAFAGSFSLEATEAVTGLDRQAAIEVLVALADRSLLHVEDTPEGARYRLLETIRQYSAEQLGHAGAAARDRHLDHYLALAESAEPLLEGPDQLVWLDRLDAELPNLRAAGEWAVASKQTERELRLVAALSFFHVYRSHASVWQGRLQRWTELAADVTPALRVKVLHAAAWASVFEGDMLGGGQFAREMLAVGRELSDEKTIGRALWFIGIVGMWADPQESAESFAAAIEASAAAGDNMFRAASQAFLGWSRFLTGDTRQARELIEQSLETSRRVGNRWNLMPALCVHAALHCMVGLYKRAETAGREAIVLSREVGDAYWLSFHLATLGWALTATGRLAEADSVLAESVQAAREGNNGIGLTYGLCCTGLLAVTRGDGVGAGTVLDEALNLSIDGGMYVLTVMASALAGAAALLRGEVGAAATHWKDSTDQARTLSFRSGLTWGLRGQALAARLRGDDLTAMALIREALAQAVPSELHPEIVDSLETIAGVMAATGGAGDAVRLLAAAAVQRERMGSVRPPAQQMLYDADRQAALEALGQSSFDAAWAEGAAMSPAEAADSVGKGRGPRGRPSFGWDSLTAVERDVVRLVAHGLSNPQIAERLFISPRTVQSHLRRIFPRLGVSSRAELAAEAARQNL